MEDRKLYMVEAKYNEGKTGKALWGLNCCGKI
jgi:hypothetical protein